MEYLTFIKLLAAHFLGDFLLQGDSFCSKKDNLESYSGWGAQAIHAVIHGVLAYLLLAEWSCWTVPVLICVSHFLIDIAKTRFDKDKMSTFVIDQLLHIVILFCCCLYLLDEECFTFTISDNDTWIIALSYILMLKPSSVFISIFTGKFEQKQESKSLPRGGQYIGYMERMLILTFILSGWMEGIGYLLAAKSVFRFGDLKNNTELRHTEYVLVGTLLSFVIAVLVGIITRYMLA